MTYRERRLAKAERLREWAGKREARDSQKSAAERRADQIPFGQPILVGHHSERRHRRDVDRAWDAMGRRVESLRTAERMSERADNIEAAAEHAIYSDDPDAVERLREKLAELEAKREKIKAANAEYRKAHRAELKALPAYERAQALPYPGYATTNLTGNISRTRKRLAQLEREAADPDPRGPGRTMYARYAGECAECREPVEKGDPMTYYRRTREVVCADCETKGAP